MLVPEIGQTIKIVRALNTWNIATGDEITVGYVHMDELTGKLWNPLTRHFDGVNLAWISTGNARTKININSRYGWVEWVPKQS